MCDIYTIELIQAVSDWQRGGDSKQKAKRGLALKKEASKLPERFRHTADRCYRQIALSGNHLRRMGNEYCLTETISSWTKDESVAKDFKGGVPPSGEYQGVIFTVLPPEGSIILDLTALFADERFLEEVEKQKSLINRYHDGIGQFGNRQKEVVIEIKTVPLDALYGWGGYSSPEHRLAKLFFSTFPNEAQLEWFRKLMDFSGIRSGAYWLTTKDAVDRVNEKLKYHAERLLQKKRTS
jgi:hypothetical protein